MTEAERIGHRLKDIIFLCEETRPKGQDDWPPYFKPLLRLIATQATEAQTALTALTSNDRCDLKKLCQAIVDHTSGGGFWIGEILLDTIKRETGYKYEPAVNQDDAGGAK